MTNPTEESISVPYPGKTAIPVTLTSPPKGVEHSGFGVILGPGAGGDDKTPLLNALALEIAKQGHFCARYRLKIPNLPFRVNGCRIVMDHLFHPNTGLHPLKGCFLGGHSMGSRVAGTLAAQVCGSGEEKKPAGKKPAAKGKKAATTSATTTTADSEYSPDYIPGLILLSYPLHTADNLKALRDQILYDIPPQTSTLFISGLKDTMCQPKIFEKVFKDMKSSPREVVQVQDASHGLEYGTSKPAKAKKEALTNSIVDWVVAFMDDTIAGLGDEKQDTKKAVVVQKKANLKQQGDEWSFTVSTA
ncbi:hypothetical protein BGZ83_002884 [Gryganskiella cystojenkinii]|nr:hypothetical protein BGZ83_002884 [Gryganskiella cystojenkinii]